MKNNWPTKKLGEIAQFLRGSGLSKKDLVPAGAYKCILYGQLYTTYGPVIDRVESRTDKRGTVLSVAGDVLVPGTTTADEIGIAVASALNESGVILGGDINIIRTENKILNSKFLAYLLSGPFKMRMAKYARGTNIIHLSGKDIAKIEVPIPPMQTQKQIVGRLDKIAEAQKLNDGLIQKSDELFQSLFYNEYEAKSNQWPPQKLEEVCEKIKQVQPKKVFEKEFSYIDIASINDEGVIRAQITSVGKAPSRARKVVKTGDTIFSTVRPYLKHIAYVPEMLNNSVASTGFCVVRPNPDLADPLFINYVVESDHFVKKILPFQRGANYPAVSDKNVYGIKVSLPPLDTQKQIVAKLSAAQDYKTQLLARRAKLKELFDSVLDKSMKGKMD